jgi:hypothetical protein
MARNSNVTKELVVGFGFFTGLWVAVGVSPNQAIINFLKPLLENLHPTLKTVFIIIPIILFLGTLITVLKVYRYGKLGGAIAVFLAFAAGTLMLKMPQYSAPLLIAAFIIGWLSFRQ